MVDISRSTSGVVLPQEVSTEILAKVQEASIIQRVSNQVTLPGPGISFQQITGDAVASWVAETGEKPVSNSTLATKTMTPYKVAVITTFSQELTRDKAALYNTLIDRLPNALAKKFDETVFHGTAPGSNFDTLENVDTIDFADVYDAFVTGVTDIGVANYEANGIILSPQAESSLFSAKDLQDRPLFISDLQTEGAIGAALGRPIFRSRHAYEAAAGGNPATYGFIGDWTQSWWGSVEAVNIKVSDQASLDIDGSTVSLFQNNMIAILAEVELSFMALDEAFRKFTVAGS